MLERLYRIGVRDKRGGVISEAIIERSASNEEALLWARRFWRDSSALQARLAIEQRIRLFIAKLKAIKEPASQRLIAQTALEFVLQASELPKEFGDKPLGEDRSLSFEISRLIEASPAGVRRLANARQVIQIFGNAEQRRREVITRPFGPWLRAFGAKTCEDLF